MGSIYTVTTGKVAAPSAAAKVAVHIATGAAVVNRWIAFDISFDGTDSTKTPILVELVKTTAAPSSGSTFTPLLVGAEVGRTAQSTARINDTTDGASPTVLASWLVPPTSGFSYQWPLGREPDQPVSAFWELRMTTVAGSGTPNYIANVWFEE